MSCFDNLIGTRSNCTNVISTSGLYVEDIGITDRECNLYINSEYKSGLDLIIDKIRFASEVVSRTVSNHFNPSINTRSLIEAGLLGHYQDSLQLKAGAVTTLGGISGTLNNQQSYYNFFVNEVSLQIDFTGTVDVFVYDLISGQLLDTIPVVTTANVISTTVVNKTYSSYKRKLDLIFVYDTEGINSNNTILYSGCGSCQGYKYNDHYITSAPVYLNEASPKVRGSLTNGTHTFGLSINYSIGCSFEKWLCQIANQMAMPILYKTGELIMDYALLESKRHTSATNVDYERNEQRKQAYAMEYNKSLEQTVSKIRIPSNDKCFFCNETVLSKIILP